MVASKQKNLLDSLMLIRKNQKKMKKQSEKAVYSDLVTFRALIRETSVFKYYVELKEEVFTKKGYLDLVKVPGLFVSGAGKFIRELREKNFLRQKDIAKAFNVKREQITKWENSLRRIPLQTLIKIVETLNYSRDTIYSFIDQGDFSLKTTLPVRFEKIRHIVQYFTPRISGYNRINLHPCSMEILSRIKETLNVKPRNYPRRRERNIDSKELYNYLKTFFRYIKVPKIHPPLTNEVKFWHEEGIDLKRTIIGPCLQSDGSMDQKNCKRIRFYNNNKILHDLFVDAMYFEYSELPTSYFRRRSGNYKNYVTNYQKKSLNDSVDALMKLMGNAKTSPARGQAVDEYLQEPQPNLNYLINAPMTEQQIAVRIWASTEGYVSFFKDRGRIKGQIYPTIAISCAHPILAKQIQQIAKRHGINFNLINEKDNWSGIGWLANKTISGCIDFLKIGGFIRGVKISSNSPYHEGIAKDILLLGILEFKKREKTDQRLKKLSIVEVHNEINKIIANTEYKSADYYINYFS
jgi:transcriptional regulator with XRE-family HTH domain